MAECLYGVAESIGVHASHTCMKECNRLPLLAWYTIGYLWEPHPRPGVTAPESLYRFERLRFLSGDEGVFGECDDGAAEPFGDGLIRDAEFVGEFLC